MDSCRAALYLRLSRDDGAGAESDSIASQRLFLREYCEKNGFFPAAEYVDDGYSGTNFERPGFLRMIDDALAGAFRVILTKDMSRLGRDYILTGEYVERFFPTHGIRYIAVNDGIDTESAGGGNDMIPFRAVFNDLYAKDISRKVRAALNAKRAAGKFIGSAAPFGYLKDPSDRHLLVPDRRCADVVVRIFDAYAAGRSMPAIAKELTDDGVPTPSRMKQDRRRKSAAWSPAMIGRILKNPTYRGNLTQGFAVKISCRTKKRRRCPPERYYTVCGTHAPLVDEALAERVDRRLAARRRRNPDRS